MVLQLIKLHFIAKIFELGDPSPAHPPGLGRVRMSPCKESDQKHSGRSVESIYISIHDTTGPRISSTKFNRIVPKNAQPLRSKKALDGHIGGRASLMESLAAGSTTLDHQYLWK